VVNKRGYIIYKVINNRSLTVYGFCRNDVVKTLEWVRYLSRIHQCEFKYSKSDLKGFEKAEEHINKEKIKNANCSVKQTTRNQSRYQ
jgi:hypothetical protein